MPIQNEWKSIMKWWDNSWILKINKYIKMDLLDSLMSFGIWFWQSNNGYLYTGEEETPVTAICFSSPNVVMKAGGLLGTDGFEFMLKYSTVWVFISMKECSNHSNRMDKLARNAGRW